MKPGLLVFWALFVAAALSCTAEAEEQSAFPLKVSPNRRYLVDQNDKPFLIVGDTAWSLIVQLDEKEIERYLDDRKQRGFNSVIVNLLEHKFCTSPPKTRAGLVPFTQPADFSAPNEDYFRFAHQVISQANRRGIVVWLAPAYLGYGGGDEGFFKEMKAGGRQKLHSYGRFLGEHFKDLPNIVWLLGGDYTPAPEDRWTITELARTISELDTNHLMTVHAAPENSAASIFGDQPWLSVNTVYSYQPTLFRPCLAEFERKPTRPFVLMETTYEGEHDSKPDQIRRQAYWAMLGGACGQFFGNNPIWHFDGPGLFPVKVTWQEALDQAGSHDVALLAKVFRSTPWHQLRPEQNHAVVTAGYGKDTATALTAKTTDGKLTIIYVPSGAVAGRELTIDLSQFTGPLNAHWFNPSSGALTEVKIDRAKTNGPIQLTVPGDNGAQANDWVLLLRAE